MESGSEDASSAVQATSLEAVGAKDVQNGDAAAVVEPEPSKNGKNESEGEFNKKKYAFEIMYPCRWIL